jgi:hypothetical protein
MISGASLWWDLKGWLIISLIEMDVRQSQFHVKNAKSVREIGYHEDKNYPARQNMEDCMFAAT